MYLKVLIVQAQIITAADDICVSLFQRKFSFTNFNCCIRRDWIKPIFALLCILCFQIQPFRFLLMCMIDKEFTLNVKRLIFDEKCMSTATNFVSGFNSFPTSGDFFYLLITFANSLDSDQVRQNIGPDLYSNWHSEGIPERYFEKLIKLEMCLWQSPRPGPSSPTRILKTWLKKRAITLVIIGRFYPKSNLTIFYNTKPGYKIWIQYTNQAF